MTIRNVFNENTRVVELDQERSTCRYDAAPSVDSTGTGEIVTSLREYEPRTDVSDSPGGVLASDTAPFMVGLLTLR